MKLRSKEVIINDEINIPKDAIIHTEKITLFKDSAKYDALRIYYLEKQAMCMNCGQLVEIVDHKLKSVPCPNPKCKKEIVL